MTKCPDIEFESAAIGKRTTGGERMRPHMRRLMTEAGWGAYAEAHRSRRFADLVLRPDLVVGCTPTHIWKLQEAAPDVPALLTVPVISDPVFGGSEAYARTWEELLQAADWLARELQERE